MQLLVSSVQNTGPRYGAVIAYWAARNTLPCPHGTSWGRHIRPKISGSNYTKKMLTNKKNLWSQLGLKVA